MEQNQDHDGVTAPDGPSLRQRQRLRRWIAAIGLAGAAAEAARADTPETNAMALLGAHAAIESLLGLIVGTRVDKRGADVTFAVLLADAVAKARLSAIPVDDDLVDDLRATNKIRNAFVHAGNAVHTEEAERAISAARELTELLPGHVAATSVCGAIADIISVPIVAMWLRHADRMRTEGRLQLACDGLARALDAGIDRARPNLEDPHDHDLARRASLELLPGVHAGLPRASVPAALATYVEDLASWVLPLALGVPPAAYARVRQTIGYEEPLDLGGHPRPVRRPSGFIPTENDVQRACSSVSQMIFHLWAVGSLQPSRWDEELIRLAQPFVENPSGLAAGEPIGPPSASSQVAAQPTPDK